MLRWAMAGSAGWPSCYLDSAATLGLPLDGYGIRYRYGIFRQEIREGFQQEAVDDWTRYGDPWSVRREDEAVTVSFGDGDVRAVPLRYAGDRLWRPPCLHPAAVAV